MTDFIRIFKADPDDNISGPPGQCTRCMWRIQGTMNCEAYPKGIPLALLTDAWDHKAEFPGDEGLRYTPAQP